MTIHVMNNKKQFEPISTYSSRDRSPLIRNGGGKLYISTRIFYKGREQACDPEEYKEQRERYINRIKQPLTNLFTELSRAPQEEDISPENILDYLHITFKEWQNVFTPDKVVEACQHFRRRVERVVQANGGYIEGRHHDH